MIHVLIGGENDGQRADIADNLNTYVGISQLNTNSKLTQYTRRFLTISYNEDSSSSTTELCSTELFVEESVYIGDALKMLLSGYRRKEAS